MPAPTVASGQSSDDLRHLVEHSANVGALDASYSTQLTDALDLQELTIGDLVRPGRGITAVDERATVADVRLAARASGHLRILVSRGAVVVGVVHVRDTLGLADTDRFDDVQRPVFRVDGSVPAYTALATMRETRSHLAFVEGPDGEGVVTMTDVLRRLFPRATVG